MPGYIPDGYTQTQKIPEGFNRRGDQIHEAVTIEFRPATTKERSELFRNWEKISQEKRDERLTAFLEGHITEWDLKHHPKDEDPVPLPVTKEVLEHLTLALTNKMIELICPTDGSDEDDAKN